MRSIALGAESFRGSPTQLGRDLVAAIHAATADVTRQSATLLAERTGIDISERVSAAQVLAGDPAAVAASTSERRTLRVEDDQDADWWREDR